jgi:hypothetical protein
MTIATYIRAITEASPPYWKALMSFIKERGKNIQAVAGAPTTNLNVRLVVKSLFAPNISTIY